MPNNFFITGLPKSGKTTLLRKIVDALKNQGKKVGGFLTPEKKEHGTREGFYAEDIESGKSAPLAVVGSSGPRVGKYAVAIKEFESIALPTMKKVDKYDVFVIDEIGKMEMKSKKFVDALDKVFESKTILLASIADDFVAQYASQGEVFVLTPTNREGVYLELLGKISSATSAAVVVTEEKKEVVQEQAKPKPPEKTKKIKEREKPQKKKTSAKKEKEKIVEKEKKTKEKKEKSETKPTSEEAKPAKTEEKESGGIFSKIKKLIGL